MSEIFMQLGLFAGKTLIVFLFIFAILLTFFILLAKGKDKLKGHLTIKNLNKKYEETTEELMAEILPKKLSKQFQKDKKAKEKEHTKNDEKPKSVYVLHFQGDIKASAVTSLREEITAILNIAISDDEVVVCVESGGGMVHAYGYAASQLLRLHKHHIPVTVAIDKIAASGGYMVASVANKILAAPFAIIGSIGVIVQLPNFHRLLKNKHIDFELHTAGEFKRTITMFGENTDEGREKLQQEIEVIHDDFKKWIVNYRKNIDISKVGTGEHWLGQQALELNLVDEIKTSDDYLFERAKVATIYEVHYEMKKNLLARLGAAANAVIGSLMARF